MICICLEIGKLFTTKKAMQTLLGGLQGPKVCANMFHDLGNGQKGELIFSSISYLDHQWGKNWLSGLYRSAGSPSPIAQLQQRHHLLKAGRKTWRTM
jgi:hypothetical protein